MNLRDYLKEHGLTQTAGAKLLDVPLRTFEYWIANPPPAYMMRMIIECLERRLDTHEFNRR